MATAVAVLRTSHRTTIIHRSLSTKPTHHTDHSRNHVYLEPTNFIGSFDPPQNPKQALSKLALIRREYAKQVKEMRKGYIEEMELQRLEKLRKDEARKLEIARQKEERQKLKALAAEARAIERKAFDEEFRLTLMKEKAEKLEYWKLRQKKIVERKNSKKELICRQSSKWVDEEELESKVLQAIVDSRVL